MMRWAAGLLLMAMVCGCATAPASPPIGVIQVAPAARDREAEVATFWAARARAMPPVAYDFYKPDPRIAYREKWRREIEERAWRDAAWGREKPHK